MNLLNFIEALYRLISMAVMENGGNTVTTGRGNFKSQIKGGVKPPLCQIKWGWAFQNEMAM